MVFVSWFSVVLENHVVTDEDEPALKRQRLEINCQDPSIKVKILIYVVFYIWCGAAITLSQFGVRRGLNHYKFTFSRFWKPEVWNQYFRRAELPSEALRECPSCLFQLLGSPQASVDSWPRPSSLCLHLHVASSMPACLFCLLQGQGHPHLG